MEEPGCEMVGEENVSQNALPKSSSFSPKVTRPKLPPFAGHSTSPRSKTDPGRGEIKAIMEDIINLKKTDWKTFSRSRTMPRSKGKSLSSESSPSPSPRLTSPTPDETDGKSPFTRDRSRSLKLLTDKLKKSPSAKLLPLQPSVSDDVKEIKLTDDEGSHTLLATNIPESDTSSANTCVAWNPQPFQSHNPSLGSPRRSPDRRSMERMYDQIPETPEDGETDVADDKAHFLSASSDESFRSVPDIIQDDYQREISPVSDLGVREKSPDSDAMVAGDSDVGEMSRSQEGELTRSQEEFVRSDKEDDGNVATYTYHPIPRNSKFLQLAATKPPKRFPPERRSGIAMVSARSPVSGLKEKRQHDKKPPEGKGSDSRHRLQRRSDSGKISGQKCSTRFITHPPHGKSSHHEAGSMDSNGFTTLLKTSTTDSDDDAKQSCQGTEHPSTSCVQLDPNQDKKNGKSSKPKSKSDPSGNKTCQALDFSPTSHSAPLLNKDKLLPDLPNLPLDGDKQKSQSDNLLSSPPVDGTTETHSSDDESAHVSDRPLSPEPEYLNLATTHKSTKVLTLSTPTTAAGSSSHAPSPTRPTNLLTVPPSQGTSRKPNIFRSASSASVLQSRKQSSTPTKEKDVVRKLSITAGEGISTAKSSVNLGSDFLPLGDTNSIATSMPAVWNKDRLSSTESPDREPGFIKDKRYHIVEELYKNEKEYVDALRTLKDKYMVPLKTQSSVEDALVDNIFYMIPEILTHHSIYLDFLDNVWKNWDTHRSTVGNIIITIFSKQTVSESYMSFVENYKTSGKVIEHALTTKSSVQKFIEQCQRESRIKLTMKDLIVRPIQRIPRYELLIQRLLDNTPGDHPDHGLLQQACRVMHDLAMKIGTVNDSQHEEDMQETLKKLELLLMSALAVPDRSYIRHDMVQMFTKKDQCCLWLFSDVVLISSIKRKSGPVTRKVSIILKTPCGPDYVENIKHKVWLRVGLDDLEIVKSQPTLPRKPLVDKEQLEGDLAIISRMSDLSHKLSCSHQIVDEALKEMNSTLQRQLVEANARIASSDSNKMELQVTTQEGVLHLVMSFASGDKRSSWESSFMDAKLKLSLLSDKRAPEFLQPLPITKTRAGMQFSCAAPIDGINSAGYRDVWVCNSDGYVGHMCLLSLQPEPIVTLNTPVPGCNARILCICAVTAFNGAFRRRTSQKGGRGQRDSVAAIVEHPRINVEPVEEDSNLITSPCSTDDTDTADRLSEEGYQSDSESSDDEPVSFISHTDELYVGEPMSDDEAPKRQVSELTESSPDPITTCGSWDQDPTKSTMWLGTEDGCIHIFQSCDNIKTTKNKLKIQHGSPVYCIIYLDNKIFVSLVNGDLIVYKRDPEGVWDTEHPYTRTIGSASSPITRMLAVAGKLWCGCHNLIHVINPLALNIETSFPVSSDTSRSVHCLVTSGQGVWVASQQSSKVLLFHAVTYDFLLEVSVAQAVSSKLQSADDIIRQHKAACLRITTLMVCKDLLWVGTSAGVILTIPIPRITSTTTTDSVAVPTVTGLVHGHTGHVRFLTSVELSYKPDQASNGSKDGEGSGGGDRISIHDIQRRSSMAAMTATMASRMLVISGGDGYEDFRTGTANEGAGRDDSTNHLLLWQV